MQAIVHRTEAFVMKRKVTFTMASGLTFRCVVAATALVLLSAFGAADPVVARGEDAPNPDHRGQFRHSVVIDGDYAVVGAEWHDGFKGAAYVLRRDGTKWVMEQKLSPGDLGRYDHFGRSTSISGDHIVVGAPWHDALRGAAYVFKRVRGEWVQQQRLSASDAVPEAQFGQTVRVDGDMIAVGKGFDDRSEANGDAAYRFVRSGERWDERAKVAVPGPDMAVLSAAEIAAAGEALQSLLAMSEIAGADAEPPAVTSAAPPSVDSIIATNGTLEDRVEVRWSSVGLDAIVYKILRDGVLLSIAASNDSLYIDTTGTLGTTYSYCVVVKDMAGQESTPTCADGSRIIFAPTSVSATDGEFTDRVVITWSDMSHIEDGYYLYRNGVRIDSTGPDTEWVNDLTAAPNTAFNYEVRAFVSDRQSAAVGDTGWRGVLLPPLDVSASDGEYLDRVVITWQDQTDAELGYRIYRDSALIDSTGVDTESYEDLDATFASTYTYCVATKSSGGTESIWVCDEGGIGLTPPGNVSASDSTYDDRITITWDDLSPGEHGYEVCRLLAADWVVLDSTRANTEIYHDFTAIPDTTYTYFVRAVNDSGGVSTFAADHGFRSIVLAPVNIEATDGTFEDHVDITWESHSTTAVLFKIYRDGTFIKSLSIGYKSYSDYGGTAGQVYDYSVVAATALEVEASGVPDNGSRALGTPSAVTASDEKYEDKIVISWVDNSQLEHGYVVSRTDTSESVVDTSYTIGPNRTSLTDFTTVPGITYSYSVAAFDSLNGTVGYSEPAEDLGLRVLLPPTGVQASDGEFEEQVEIFWQDNSNAEDGYRIYRDDVLIGETADNFTSHVDSSPILGHISEYSITAFDSVPPLRMGESEAASDSGYTTILAPVSFNASDVYEDRIELTWVDVSNVETGYEIWRDSGPSTPIALLDVTGANITDYQDIPLERGMTHRYCIRAIGNGTLASTEVCDDGSRFLEADIETIELSLKLEQSAALPGDKYGISVAVDGDAAIVGAHDESNENGTRAGAAYIFERDAAGNWIRKQKLLAPVSGADNDDRFGSTVAIGGDVAVVGVPNDLITAKPGAGSVHIFERNLETDTWELAGTVERPFPSGWVYYGSSVAVSGDLLVVGCVTDGPPWQSGAVYIYRRQSNGDWILEGDKIQAGDAGADDHFGTSVAISGDAVIVGASRHDGQKGAAYILRWDGQDWSE